MEELAVNRHKSYVQSTTDNYQSRFKSFKEWATEDKNANAAKRCRDVLMHFLSLRMAQMIEMKRIESIIGSEIRLLDAGCGPGRDLKEFSHMYLTIPMLGPKHIEIEANNKKCFNPSCSICENLQARENKLSTMILHKVKVAPCGFDPCTGFVETCRNMGLNVVLADFVNFFDSPQENQNEKQHSTTFHGIFALASLFHLPKMELEKVLYTFRTHLVPYVGVLLTSIPNGTKDKMGSDGRWKLHLSQSEQIGMLENAGFEVLFQEQMSIYNGDDWIVLVSVIKS